MQGMSDEEGMDNVMLHWQDWLQPLQGEAQASWEDLGGVPGGAGARVM